MKFTVNISPVACDLLVPALRWRLARRAARKVMRMGSSSALVIFHGPEDLRVIVNCPQTAIQITTGAEAKRQSTLRLLRKSA